MENGNGASSHDGQDKARKNAFGARNESNTMRQDPAIWLSMLRFHIYIDVGSLFRNLNGSFDVWLGVLLLDLLLLKR